MKILDHIEIALRTAFKECVQAVGGARNMGALLAYDEPKISRLHNCENTEVAASSRAWLRIGEAVRADICAGSPIMLSAMAALEGYSINQAERTREPRDMHEHLASLAKEFSEAVNELATGGIPSPAKARRIRTELQDVINKANDCIAECDHIIAGEKPRIVGNGK